MKWNGIGCKATYLYSTTRPSSLYDAERRHSRGKRMTPAGAWEVYFPRRGGGSTTVRPRVSYDFMMHMMD